MLHLIDLKPFIKNGVIYVGGRLGNSNLFLFSSDVLIFYKIIYKYRIKIFVMRYNLKLIGQFLIEAE